MSQATKASILNVGDLTGIFTLYGLQLWFGKSAGVRSSSSLPPCATWFRSKAKNLHDHSGLPVSRRNVVLFLKIHQQVNFLAKVAQGVLVHSFYFFNDAWILPNSEWSRNKCLLNWVVGQLSLCFISTHSGDAIWKLPKFYWSTQDETFLTQPIFLDLFVDFSCDISQRVF